MARPVTKSNYSDLPELYASRDNLPEAYASPNEALEPVRKSTEKEIVGTREDDIPEVDMQAARTAEDTIESAHPRPDRKRRWITVAAIVLLLAIALGVGLCVGLSRSSTSTETTSSPPDTSDEESPNSTGSNHSSPDQTLSTRGAFNGTDIAVSKLVNLDKGGVLLDANDSPNPLVVYQHFSGQIRWIQYHLEQNSTYGGTSDQVIANDAKNRTPIDVTITREPGLALHVFYVSRDNIAKEIVLGKSSTSWSAGLLNELNYSVADIERPTLRVGRSQGPSIHITPESEEYPCTELFISRSSTEFDELLQCDSAGWELQKTWDGLNAEAGPAFRGWVPPGADAILYVAFVDLDGNVKMFWKDTTQNITNTASRPMNVWLPATDIEISDLEPSAGLTGFGDGTLMGRAAGETSVLNWKVSLLTSNSTASLGWSFVPPAILDDSLLEVLLDAGDLGRTYLWYQATGDDIMMAIGDESSGFASYFSMDVPDN